MRAYRIWLGIALVSFGLAAATAQGAPEASVTVTSESWPCMKKWVDASNSASIDPFKFPVYSNGDCSRTLASRPFDYSVKLDGWMFLRVSEAQCLSGLGPTIDKTFSSGVKSSLTVSLKRCKILG